MLLTDDKLWCAVWTLAISCDYDKLETDRNYKCVFGRNIAETEYVNFIRDMRLLLDFIDLSQLEEFRLSIVTAPR